MTLGPRPFAKLYLTPAHKKRKAKAFRAFLLMGAEVSFPQEAPVHPDQFLLCGHIIAHQRIGPRVIGFV